MLLTENFGLPDMYDMLFNMGAIIVGIAAFQTVIAGYFIFQPNAKRPRINLFFILVTIVIGVFDFMYVNLLTALHQMVTAQYVLFPWNIASWIFALLGIPPLFPRFHFG